MNDLYVIKRGDSLIKGPATRVGNWDMEIEPFKGYESLGDIADIFREVRVPDFTEQHAKVAGITVEIPDDPIDIGFTETKRLLSNVAEQYRLLSSYRGEIIGIKTEWISLKIAFDHLIATECREATDMDGYKECKNADQRQAFLSDIVSEFDDIEVAIMQAIQRCNDFIELCRIKGKELDFSMTALDKQLTVIKLQVKLGFIRPEETDEN